MRRADRMPSFAPLPSRRMGFALAAALLALVLIAALVSGVLFATNEEARIESASAHRQRALSAAESSIEGTIAAWPKSGIAPAVGATAATTTEWGGIQVRIHVTRLDSSLYWIVAEANAGSSRSGVARRIGAVVGARRLSGDSITIDRISERWWSELF